MAQVPASSHGGSLPAGWTAGAGGDVEIETDGAFPVITIQLPVGFSDDSYLKLKYTDGSDVFILSGFGDLFLVGPANGGPAVIGVQATDYPGCQTQLSESGLNVAGDDSVHAFRSLTLAKHNASQPFMLVLDSDTSQPLFRIDADGSVHIKTGTTIQADL